MFTELRAKADELNSQFSSVFNNKETENIPVPCLNLIPTINNCHNLWSLRGLKADKAYAQNLMRHGNIFSVS